MKVLIVDDEAAILELLTFAFSRKQIPVETAPDAEQGLALTKRTQFDGALLDKNLPGMNGLELIRKIRESDSRMAILMMTGFASPETALEALNLDVDGYLEKPFPNLGTVVDRMTQAIEKRRAAAPRQALTERPALSVPLTKPDPVAPPPLSPPAAVPGATAPPTPAVAAAPPAASAAAMPPVRILMVASADMVAKVKEGFGPNDETILARKETELFSALATPADVVIVDSFLLAGEVVPIVERVKRVSENAEFIVFADRALDLRTVQKLIDYGVRRVVQSASWPRALRSALDAARKKKTPA